MNPEDIFVHKKYNGDPCCGYDIAVAPIVKIPHEKSTPLGFEEEDDIFWGFASPKSINVGLKVEVAGFPGDKEGWSYYHSGKIKGVKKTDLGGWILFYDTDTTPGNSGSDIHIIDESWIKKHSSSGWKKKTIGVHTGHDEGTGLNYGTLITPSLLEWIRSATKSKRVKTVN